MGPNLRHAACLIRLVRSLQGQFRGYLNHSIKCRIDPWNSVQIGFDDLDGGHLFSSDQPGQGGGRRIMKLDGNDCCGTD